MIYISKLASRELTEYLKSKGKEIKFVEDSSYISSPISSHADLRYVRLSGFDEEESLVYTGEESALGSEYPKDCLYNAAVLGKYIICSKYTSSDLITKSEKIPIVVPQGYVKCNLLVLDDKHAITEDAGIYKVLAKYEDIDVLLISPKGVKLSGYEYGFIGGASGRVDDEIIFNGRLEDHKDYEKIKAYIKALGLKLKTFSYELTDIGSIVEG